MKAVIFRLPTIYGHFRVSLFTSICSQSDQFLAYQKSAEYEDTYKFNIKLTSLGRDGKVNQARQLFDEMSQRDSVSYASMITIYLKNNHLLAAEKLFQTMPMPYRTIVAVSAMVDGYAKAGFMDQARKLFDNMSNRNVFSWTSLISGYFKIGKVDEAINLFNQMPMKNVVSWTTVVLGYARNGLIDEARYTFNQMPQKNIVAWTCMIKAYVENDQIDEACKLFYVMPQRNLYSWNIIISSCLAHRRVDEAIRLFESIRHLSNVVSWTTMVTGLAQNGFITEARGYFDRMPIKDIAAWNAMITAYADQCLMIEARELFDAMHKRNILTWNAMIDGYSRKDGANGEALNLLIHMLRSCVMPNETTITIIISSSCRCTLELIQAHALAMHHGLDQDTKLANALINTYARSGDLSSASIAFQNAVTKDVVSWTSMILAYSIHGHGEHALLAFAQMLKSGIKPDGITFVGVLSACSHTGLVKKGKSFFNSMSSVYGLEPKAEHYSCLVDILGRAGEVNEALQVVHEMPPSKRDGAVLGAMLAACKQHAPNIAASNNGIAYEVGEKLIELEPNSAGAYVLLGNVYASCGKWDEFAKLRKKMKERNVKKVPGVSQIDVNGKSHSFCVGDKSHPQGGEIYRLLRENLLPVMLEEIEET